MGRMQAFLGLILSDSKRPKGYELPRSVHGRWSMRNFLLVFVLVFVLVLLILVLVLLVLLVLVLVLLLR